MINDLKQRLSGVRAADATIIAAGILLFYAVRVSVLSGDSLLAWPITDKLIHPDFYGSNDLIVNAGVTGNFLFYKVLASVPFLGSNLPLRDLLVYIPVFTLFVGAWFLVFLEISGNARLSAMAILLFLFSDLKLGLNWSITPNASLISQTSVQFLQVFALWLFLVRRRLFSYLLLGATAVFHPATAMVFFLLFTAVAVTDQVRGRQRGVLPQVAIGALSFLPAVAMIVSHSQGSFQVPRREFFEIFSAFQYHAYLEDHFSMGYAFCLALMAVLHFVNRAGSLPVRHEEELRRLFLCGLLGSAVWLANLYTFEQLQFVQTFFVTRVFYFLKPLLVLLVLMAGTALYRHGTSRLDVPVALALCATVFTLSPTLSLIIAVSTAGYLADRKTGLVLFAVLCSVYAGAVLAAFPRPMFLHVLRTDRAGDLFVPLELFISIAILPVLLLSLRRKGTVLAARTDGERRPDVKWYFVALAVMTALALNMPAKLRSVLKSAIAERPDLQLTERGNFGINRADPDYGALLDWAKRTPARTFVVPPYDNRFLSFRYLTKNGIFGHQSDQNQLAYSPDFYLRGYARLLQAGLLPGSGGKYAWQWTYDELSARELRALQADLIVFSKQTFSNVQGLTCRPVYENGTYVVYDLRQI